MKSIFVASLNFITSVFDIILLMLQTHTYYIVPFHRMPTLEDIIMGMFRDRFKSISAVSF